MAKNYYDITLAPPVFVSRHARATTRSPGIVMPMRHVSLNSIIDMNPSSTLAVLAVAKPTCASGWKPCSACSMPAVAVA